MSCGNIHRFKDVSRSACMALRHRHAHDLDGFVEANLFLETTDRVLEKEGLERYHRLSDLMNDMRKGANRPRFQQLWYNGKLLGHRCIQGHSGNDIDSALSTRCKITSADIQYIWHMHCMSSILEKGLLPGGINADRREVYFACYNSSELSRRQVERTCP